jgi:NAD(P)-dependent dehydrogenase (short-subunit alcohol dehydrogenase family)
MENSTNQYPTSAPAQVQSHQPGDQEKMHPEPEIIKSSHKGSDKLKGKVAVISGGDSGIGRSVAVLFAREGADIAILYLEEDQDAEITKQLVEREGQHCLLLKGDISDPDVAKLDIDKVLQHYGKINILVNNAGVQYQQKEIESISNEQLEKTFKTNIFPMFYLTKEAIPYMEEGDSIINTTSITSYQGHDELIDYASTKGAITTFTRSLSNNLMKQKKGIRVNGIAPGWVATPGNAATGRMEEAAKSIGTETAATFFKFLGSGCSKSQVYFNKAFPPKLNPSAKISD